MIKCQNCGNINTTESNFCRFCGTRFNDVPAPQRSSPPPRTDLGPPRPYSWKTDEFTTTGEARKTIGDLNRVADYDNAGSAGPMVQQQQRQFSQPYRCPHCMSQFLPRIDRRISTAGWVTFAVLLVFFFPLFWIGLLIKEEMHVCPSCNSRVN